MVDAIISFENINEDNVEEQLQNHVNQWVAPMV
jgi:hypothetical protein